jgi:hypothetical protein
MSGLSFKCKDLGFRCDTPLYPHTGQRGEWLDYWTWAENNGGLPSLDRLWGCAGVKKAVVRAAKSIGETYPGDVGRCWVCGQKVSEGHLCSSECEEAYNTLANKR